MNETDTLIIELKEERAKREELDKAFKELDQKASSLCESETIAE